MPPSLLARETALLTANRRHLLQALQGSGLTQIQVRYGGRHGRCTHCLVSTTPSDALITLQNTPVTQHTLGSALGKEGTVTTSLLAALKEFSLHWVELQQRHWTRDDGGDGIMTIEVSSCRFTLEHNAHLTENFCYRLVD